MLHRFVACVSLALSVSAAGTTTTESLADRSFIVHLPSAYNNATNVAFPLVLNLHGFVSSADEQMAFSNMNDHADQNDYIAVYPQGLSMGTIGIDPDTNPLGSDVTYWNEFSFSGSPGPLGPTCNGQGLNNDLATAIRSLLPSECADALGCNLVDCTTDDIGFIEDVLDRMEADYRVDSSRVYVTGFSLGGQMTQRLGCELSERFAAIAPISGQPKLGFNCAPSNGDSLPILSVWATQDDVQPGMDITSAYGDYITPVHHVMFVMGEHNGCDVEEEPAAVSTSADGIRRWECVGYESCDFDVMSCSWNATHSEFPTTYTEDGHFGLDVVWDFFQKYLKPQRERRRGGKPGKGAGNKDKGKGASSALFWSDDEVVMVVSRHTLSIVAFVALLTCCTAMLICEWATVYKKYQGYAKVEMGAQSEGEH